MWLSCLYKAKGQLPKANSVHWLNAPIKMEDYEVLRKSPNFEAEGQRSKVRR